MKSLGARFVLSILTAASALSSVACEKCQVQSNDGSTTTTKSGYCSVKKFVPQDRTASAALGDGKNVTIKSVNGNVTVSAGGTEVKATFHPFVYRAFNVSDSELQKNWDQLVTTATADASGNVTVSVTRKDGAPNTLGADFDVQIPSSFAGAFTVDQNNGDTDVHSVAGATSVSITSDNGGITVNAGSTASTVNVTADTGDVTVDIDAVPDGATGGTISTNFGDVVLRLPSTGSYAVPATAKDSVNFGTAPSGCTVEEAAVNSKTLSCNGSGAVFNVSADGVGSTVTASY